MCAHTLGDCCAAATEVHPAVLGEAGIARECRDRDMTLCIQTLRLHVLNRGLSY